MYFKKLELLGFKSFMDKTTLHFEPGVTAVVGPNGCGKSNIFDSIRWVLGEQSVKALRGAQMEDVIFNGTDSKESLGMAEVSVTFDNLTKFFPVDQDEVIITRRIFRSGESEYLLNKIQVRLKDISELLAGTGVGAESYSLVEQGKIDLVLSSRPEDRRLVFDEAAGITKYKSQKREALRKLEDTQQNLLRANDIVTEVKRQITSLERQAAKARRYKEVFEELKNKEVNYAIHQRNILLKQKDELIAELNNLELKEADFLRIIKEQESQINLKHEALKILEDKILEAKNQILSLDNLVIRNQQHINFNTERVDELNLNRQSLETQLKQTENKIIESQVRLDKARVECESIKKEIELKTAALQEKQTALDNLLLSTKTTLENIVNLKKSLLDLLSNMAHLRNEISDLTSKQQVSLARKKRLEVERSKVNEEKAVAEIGLSEINKEVQDLSAIFDELSSKVASVKNTLENAQASLNLLIKEIEELEREKISLESHKEFLDKLKTKYEDISESMGALIYLDKMPTDLTSGLVIRINEYLDKDNPGQIKLKGEAKPIDLDTRRIEDKINQVKDRIIALKNEQEQKTVDINKLNQDISEFQIKLRDQEMLLVNKKAAQQAILEQFRKIAQEDDVITIEYQEIQDELSLSEGKISNLRADLLNLEYSQKNTEETIAAQQNSIAISNDSRERFSIEIAQIRAEADGLSMRMSSEEETLRILERAHNQDKENITNIQTQIRDTYARQDSLAIETKELESQILQIQGNLEIQKAMLAESEQKYLQSADELNQLAKKIDADKADLDLLKEKLYKLQMQNKDLDFKAVTIKDRIAQGYKVDIDSLADVAALAPQEIDLNLICADIDRLKEKLNNYGTVNLVAIEEYDELKKRYDFLTQQQNDLNAATESLHDAILKLNRDTKKMFLETFEKVQVEFRNYFKMLFNGGDAQLFLIDEHDPLESGIEIICRPPGKKLQNVLLLSGGEKSMSAIALIFAIFKIKPSPFCILDEIDAALDEANVDRFGRMLQEFTKNSQFIIITHNKKTIANANVMYGITMEESGVSKIVSVKFAENKVAKNNSEDAAVKAA